jgi:hypothetical protein
MWIRCWGKAGTEYEKAHKTACIDVDEKHSKKVGFWTGPFRLVDRLLIASHESNPRTNKHYK